jgi:hypothetical protein
MQKTSKSAQSLRSITQNTQEQEMTQHILSSEQTQNRHGTVQQ